MPPGLGPWTRLVGGRHLLGPVLSGGRGTVRSVNPKGRRRDGNIHASVTATARRIARTANSRPPASARRLLPCVEPREAASAALVRLQESQPDLPGS